MTGTWEVSGGTVHESGAACSMCNPSSNRDEHVSPPSAGPACPGRQGASSDMPHMTAHGPRAHILSLRGNAFGMQAVLYFPPHPYTLEYSVRLGHQELCVTAQTAIGSREMEGVHQRRIKAILGHVLLPVASNALHVSPTAASAVRMLEGKVRQMSERLGELSLHWH